MYVVSFFNIKGGVGKTTSTVNYAACLSEKDKKILVIDLDPQANATKSFNCYSIDNLCTTDVLLEKELSIKEVIKHTEYNNIDMLPSNITLAAADRSILTDVSRSQQNRLSKALNEVKNDYDYVLIDCPTTLNTVTINAMVASDDIVVPLKIDKYALDGLELVLNNIEEVKQEFNEKLNFKGVLVTMDRNTRVNTQIKDVLKDQLGDKLLKTTIRNTNAVNESTFDVPLVFSNKKSTASVDYQKSTEEIFNI